MKQSDREATGSLRNTCNTENKGTSLAQEITVVKKEGSGRVSILINHPGTSYAIGRS